MNSGVKAYAEIGRFQNSITNARRISEDNKLNEVRETFIRFEKDK
jgi:hypothetical protein